MKNLLVVLLPVVVASCGKKTFKTEGGTVVTYIKKGTGAKPIDSLLSLYNIKYTTPEGKVMMETDAENPIVVPINIANAPKQGELFNIFLHLKVGDSVTFSIPANDLFDKTFKAPLPDSIEADAPIKFALGYVEQVSEKDYYARLEAKEKRVGQAQLEVDNEILETYFEENNIVPVKTESGLRYVVTKKGNGTKPQVGQKVQVNYTGRILDGAYFDTSVEADAKAHDLYNEGRTYQPFTFSLGQGQVIKGWDEGIGLLDVGAKATLYIPSPLGYGSKSAGSVITPNSILVFDVELIGISQ